jgi:serine/alanine racemase
LRTVGVIFFLLYLVGLTGTSYFVVAKQCGFDGLLSQMSLYVGPTRNGLFFAPIYVFAGAWFATAEQRICIKTKWLILWLILFALLFLSEVIVITECQFARMNDMTLFLLPVTFLIFVLSARSELKFRLNYPKFREFSSSIYFFHPLPILLFDLTILNKSMAYGYLIRFLFVLICSLLFAIFFYHWDEKIKKWLV